MERALTDWAVCRDDADPYKPPEWNPLYLAGCCDGRDITTSHIKEVLAPRLYRTRSGARLVFTTLRRRTKTPAW